MSDLGRCSNLMCLAVIDYGNGRKPICSCGSPVTPLKEDEKNELLGSLAELRQKKPHLFNQGGMKNV